MPAKPQGDSTGTVEYICEFCATTFIRRSQSRGRKPHYCSGKCRNLAYEARRNITPETVKARFAKKSKEKK